jgi:hypothetical protein
VCCARWGKGKRSRRAQQWLQGVGDLAWSRRLDGIRRDKAGTERSGEDDEELHDGELNVSWKLMCVMERDEEEGGARCYIHSFRRVSNSTAPPGAVRATLDMLVRAHHMSVSPIRSVCAIRAVWLRLSLSLFVSTA